MNIDRAVMVFAGVAVLAGLALGYYVNPLWFLLPALAGINLIQAPFTGFCPAAILFRMLGVPAGHVFR